MEPRKKRKRMKDRKGRIKRMGKMFPKIRLARILKVHATENEAEVGFKAGTDSRIASVHQYGEVDSVGRTRGGQVVKTRYPARRLLGFGAEDIDAIMDAALKLLEK
jgi:phage virion morphogenesis protein